MAESIVGRVQEQRRLKEILHSGEAELVAIYGRRRVGKTFLVRQFFAEHTFFEVTGEKGQIAKLQIVVFLDELPWLASHRSGLLPALDHSWNARLSKIAKLRLILCGSAVLILFRRGA